MWEDSTKTIAQGIVEDSHEDTWKDCCATSNDGQNGILNIHNNVFLRNDLLTFVTSDYCFDIVDDVEESNK